MTEQSPSIANLATALVAAQGDLHNPAKNSVNPFFNSQYVTLAAARNAIAPALAQHGLVIVQMPTTLDGQPALASSLLHSSGEWIRSTALLCAAKGDPQGQGSAISYLRRYSMLAIAGVAAEDDDGNTASNRPAAAKLPPRQAEIVRPSAKPAPRPTRISNDDLRALLELKGWTVWSRVVKFINREEDESYSLNAMPMDIDVQHLTNFCNWLRQQPNKKATATA